MKNLKDLYVVAFILIIVVTIILAGQLFAAMPAEKMERIEQDIEIMEKVLDEIIIKESPIYFNFDDQVQGIYLEGFGVLFDIESIGLGGFSGLIRRTIKRMPDIDVKHHGDDRVTIKIRKKEGEEDEEQIESAKEKIRVAKESIMDFFADYASSVKSLGKDDQICINIRLRNDFEFIKVEEEKDKIPGQFRICAKVTDLSDYRKGKISKSKLKKLIEYTEVYEEGDDMDLVIMEKILDTSLSKFGRSTIPGFGSKTRGMYLNDFGALFFSPTTLGQKFGNVIVRKVNAAERKLKDAERKLKDADRELSKHEEKLKALEKRRQKEASKRISKKSGRKVVHKRSDEGDSTIVITDDFDFDFDFDFDCNFEFDERLDEAEVDSIANEISDNILEILGQYGHTLRKVKENEWIMVALDLDNHLWDQDWRWLYIKVRKSDITKYSREKIKLEELKKHAKIRRG